MYFKMGNVWLPFHQRKLRQMQNINPMKKFSMMIVGQHLGIPFHQRNLTQMGSINCPMMKFSMMIQIRLTILIAGQYWIPFHQRKLRKMGNVNPMKKFSMMIAGQHWIPFHQRKLRQIGNVDPVKTFSMMIADQHWITFQQRKRDLLGGSLSEEGFKASRTPVRVPVVLADDQGHPTDLFLTISVQQRKFCWGGNSGFGCSPGK